MNSLLLILALFISMVGFVSGDPNIYGPGGVNLGPNGDPEQQFRKLQHNEAFEVELEKIRVLQQQVEQLQLQQKKQQQEQKERQEQLNWNRQNQQWIQIQIPSYNYNYNPYSYGSFGWSGINFWSGGSFSRRFPGHHRDGIHQGLGIGHSHAPPRR
jgi:hypothetical protein